MMFKYFRRTVGVILCVIVCLSFVSCSKISGNISRELDTDLELNEWNMEIMEIDEYKQISQEYAKYIMDNETDYVILDVHEQDEYDEGHIPGAILIPYMDIESLVEDVLKDKDQKILVYCRSGRRSKIAAANLASLGYTNVYEFGGIIDWRYDIE